MSNTSCSDLLTSMPRHILFPVIQYNVMKVEKNLYESPKVEAMEIIVEQAILTASGDDAPDFGRGSDWEWN